MNTIGSWKVSDLANAFPILEGDDFEELKASILQYGLQNPIVVNSQDEILDGRNRMRACLLVGAEPEIEQFTGTREEQIAFVAIQNLNRRHLTQSQKALITAEFLRLQHGGVLPNEAVRQAAIEAGVSPRLVYDAGAVLKNADDNEIERIRSGEISVGKALSDNRGGETQVSAHRELQESKEMAALRRGVTNILSITDSSRLVGNLTPEAVAHLTAAKATLELILERFGDRSSQQTKRA